MAIANVIIFWTPVEILGHINFFNEIWTAPMNHKKEMIIILVAFLLLAIYLWYMASQKKQL